MARAAIHRPAELTGPCAVQPQTAGASRMTRSASGGLPEAKAAMVTAPPILSPATAMTARGWRARARATAVRRSSVIRASPAQTPRPGASPKPRWSMAQVSIPRSAHQGPASRKAARLSFMPCRAMMTAQGSPVSGVQRASGRRAPSSIRRPPASTAGPVKPGGGVRGGWMAGVAQAASARTANRAAQDRIMASPCHPGMIRRSRHRPRRPAAGPPAPRRSRPRSAGAGGSPP